MCPVKPSDLRTPRDFTEYYITSWCFVNGKTDWKPNNKHDIAVGASSVIIFFMIIAFTPRITTCSDWLAGRPNISFNYLQKMVSQNSSLIPCSVKTFL